MKKSFKEDFLNIILLFLFFSFIGWFWELLFDLLSSGNLANHGVLLGPWLPIYGWGGLIIYILLNRFQKMPIVVFMGAFVFCTVIEYCTAWYLETFLHHKWWSYSGMPFNIDGRICLLSSLSFGVAGLLGIYILIPRFKKLISKIPVDKLFIYTLLLLSLFIIDELHSIKYPHIVKKYKVISNERLDDMRLFKK